MRTIKFRAWHKKYKKMYEVHDLILNSYPGEINPKVWANCWGRDMIEDKDIILHVEDLELMQFTGLTDKNGKEIYEGDIVTWYSGVRHDKVFIISWEENEGKLMYCDPKTTLGIGGFYKKTSEYCQVIDNIYENNSLLIRNNK